MMRHFRPSVTISEPFILQATPVTRGEFAGFITETGYVTDAEKTGFVIVPDGLGRMATRSQRFVAQTRLSSGR